MIYKRDKKEEATKENPVALPVETIKLSETDAKIFTDALQETIKTHKDTLTKLRDSDFTESAYGMFKNKTTGMWFTVEIKYDPLNLTVSPNLTAIDLLDNSRDYAQEKFKILLSEKIL